MHIERAFLLAGRTALIADAVCGAAHATANVMVQGPVRERTKGRIEEAREVLTHYQDLVFTVFPAAMEYRPDMPEAELRAWAERMVGACR